jgi:hypothetical protein
VKNTSEAMASNLFYYTSVYTLSYTRFKDEVGKGLVQRIQVKGDEIQLNWPGA